MLRRAITSAAVGALICLAAAILGRADSIPCDAAPGMVFSCIRVPEIKNRSGSTYLQSTTWIDIYGLIDRERYSDITGGGLKVGFSRKMTRLTIPRSWAGWGNPPATQKDIRDCSSLGIENCPPVLWSTGSNTITMTLTSAKPVLTFGFEAEPNRPESEMMMAVFLDSGGKEIGRIDLTPSGYFGALLFAASSNTPIKSVQLTDLKGRGFDFAIANVRFSSTRFVPIPEPASVLLLATGLASLAFWKLRMNIAIW